MHYVFWQQIAAFKKLYLVKISRISDERHNPADKKSFGIVDFVENFKRINVEPCLLVRCMGASKSLHFGFLAFVSIAIRFVARSSQQQYVYPHIQQGKFNILCFETTTRLSFLWFSRPRPSARYHLKLQQRNQICFAP